MVFTFSKCTLASDIFLSHVKKQVEIELLIKIFTNRILYMLFSLHSIAYKPNSYLTISWFENKTHTYEKSAVQGETQKLLLKYTLEGESHEQLNSFYICLNHTERPPPLSISAVLKPLSIRRAIYKPNNT